MEKKFERNTFAKRLKSMLAVDFRRAFTGRFLYIMVGISFVIPILILIMTTMMDGSVSTDQDGNQVVMEGFKNVWQILGATSSESAVMDMSLTGMCNINMLYFAIIVFVCIFVADDFRSGYAKNLFTVRAKKTDYIISKTLIGFVGAAIMFIAFLIGSLIGGGVAKLPFDMNGFTLANVFACLFSKIGLSLIFVAVCVLASVIGKQKSWLSVLLSLGFGMLFFTMIPMLTPLDADFIRVVVCLGAGGLFSAGIGCISNLVLKKTSLV